MRVFPKVDAPPKTNEEARGSFPRWPGESLRASFRWQRIGESVSVKSTDCIGSRAPFLRRSDALARSTWMGLSSTWMGLPSIWIGQATVGSGHQNRAHGSRIPCDSPRQLVRQEEEVLEGSAPFSLSFLSERAIEEVRRSRFPLVAEPALAVPALERLQPRAGQVAVVRARHEPERARLRLACALVE